MKNEYWHLSFLCTSSCNKQTWETRDISREEAMFTSFCSQDSARFWGKSPRILVVFMDICMYGCMDGLSGKEPVRSGPVSCTWLGCHTTASVKWSPVTREAYLCIMHMPELLTFFKTRRTLSFFEKPIASSEWCARSRQQTGQETLVIRAIIRHPEPGGQHPSSAASLRLL